MIFVSLKRSAQLDFTTPLQTCCNCGTASHLALVETPLRRTRYMLFGGTELTIEETFPYCTACKGSAARVRPGLAARVLCGVLVTAAVFAGLCIRLSMNVDAFTPWVREHLFVSSIVAAAVVTLVYFRWRDSNPGGRSYYQPVRLADVAVEGNQIGRVKLGFFDKHYAHEFTAANKQRVRAGLLEVIVD